MGFFGIDNRSPGCSQPALKHMICMRFVSLACIHSGSLI
jgi:hypothetical protein